jgi:hypothetical protein
MQMPQGLDAQHRGELFPVNESYAAPSDTSEIDEKNRKSL